MPDTHTSEKATMLWLEAEQFDHLGGWVNDSQFIDLMGSPYLLANGRGMPVEDATTTVDVPAPGPYRLWARTKDWVPKHHPGPFEILLGEQALNGLPVAHTFGRSGQTGWTWEDGGVHELSGQVSLALHDLSGYYGRCDVVVLTDDLDWAPPSDVGEIEALRVRYGGLSAEIDEPPPYDIVIVGGGLAGCTAAVAAARNGASVALIQNRPMLGGNASTEILVPPCGVWNAREEGPFDPHETGLIEEYRTAGRQIATEGKLYTGRLLRWVQAEPDVDLYLNTHALRAEKKNIAALLTADPQTAGMPSTAELFSDTPPTGTSSTGTPTTDVPVEDLKAGAISSVLTMNVRTGQRTRFRAQIFIDCSGDSGMGVSAGAEWRQGKEPRSMYDEPWAPEEPSPNTMGNGLKYYPVDTGQAVAYAPPPWIMPFPTCDSFMPGRHPKELGFVKADGQNIGRQWFLELGGTRDTYADAEEIRDDLFRLIYGLWDHLKNHCPENAEVAATWDLGWVGHVAGKRENRRLIGDVVLTHHDILNKTPFEDAVAYGAWVVDDHYSEGFFHDGQFGTHQDDHDLAAFGEEFSIPFRCLYSRNVNNLMMAGRNISASHLAMSDTRVMFTCALMGHAAGTGAALCIHKELSPRGIYQDCMDQLQQQLLKEGAYIIGLRADDGRDLAPKAQLWASSENVLAGGEKLAAANAIDGYGRAVPEHTHAWAPDPTDPGPHRVELTWNEPVTFNVVHVCFQKVDLSPASFAVEIWQDGRWRAVAEIADNRHRRHVLGLERATTTRLRIVEDTPAGIVEIRVYNEPERQVEIARRAHANMRLPDVGPFLPWEKP